MERTRFVAWVKRTRFVAWVKQNDFNDLYDYTARIMSLWKSQGQQLKTYEVRRL
jgi:hypothetical protein